MKWTWRLTLLPVSIALLVAGEQPWKDKQIAEWSDDDAKLVLTDSPWAKTVTPAIDRTARNNAQRRPMGGGMGRGGGIGIGIPGIGRRYPGGYPGGGYPGGGYPGGGYPGGTTYPGGQQGGTYPGGSNGGSGGSQAQQPPELTLRWESAMPVREAELKTRDANAPTIEENTYAIAVYGLPGRLVPGDSQSLVRNLKAGASLKRDGKKDLKPSNVVILHRESGPVILYLFARPKAKDDLAAGDKRVEFDAKIGRASLSESFFLDDMVYQGKLAL